MARTKAVPAAPQGKKGIWCLFSVDNNYDQPDNNLVCWWLEKPDLLTLSKALNRPNMQASDETIVAIVKIWTGDNGGEVIDDTRYSLKQVFEGDLL